MNKLILINPENDQVKIDAMRNALIEAQREAVELIDDATAGLTADNYTMAKKSAFKDRVSFFTEGGKKLAKLIMASCGADAVMVQIAASEAAVKAADKAYQAKWDQLKAENTPKGERFEYIAEFCMTDAEWLKFTTKLAKDGIEFRARRVKDNESAKIGKIFEDK